MFLAILSDEGKKLFYELEVLLAGADENFDASEEAIIRAHCYEMGIGYTGINVSSRSVDEIIKEISDTLSDSEKKAIFIEMIIVSLADDEYHESEKEIIDKLSTSFGIEKNISDEVFNKAEQLMKASKSLQSFVG